MSQIWVVIPYYQKKVGLLSQAINTVLAQKDCGEPNILVVDDGSPISAALELHKFLTTWPNRIKLVKQANGGAATARNTGLDNLPAGTDFVAFLDSDDRWPTNHLSHALKAFEMNADFYFANHQRDDWNQDKFAKIGFDSALHVLTDQSEQLYLYKGERILPFIRDHMIQTSTVVYSWKVFSELRFPTTLPLFEDEVFWIWAFQKTEKVLFSPAVESRMGRGVNISQGGEWGSLRSLDLMSQYAKFWSMMPGLFSYDAKVESFRSEMQNKLRKDFLGTILHRIKRGKRIPLYILGRFMKTFFGG